jgi:hypothetical protein
MEIITIATTGFILTMKELVIVWQNLPAMFISGNCHSIVQEFIPMDMNITEVEICFSVFQPEDT